MFSRIHPSHIHQSIPLKITITWLASFSPEIFVSSWSMLRSPDPCENTHVYNNKFIESNVRQDPVVCMPQRWTPSLFPRNLTRKTGDMGDLGMKVLLQPLHGNHPCLCFAHLWQCFPVTGGEFGTGTAQQYGEADISGKDFHGQVRSWDATLQ